MKIESGTGHLKTIQTQVTALSNGVRLKRAAKKIAAFFGLAVFSVFIPVLHFFLVPAFLGLCFYFGWKEFRYTKFVDLTGVTCPVCEHDLNEGLLFYRDEFVRLYCYQCQTQLKVT